jgi:hypothetical protein
MPARRITALADSNAATANAKLPPIQPTSAPPSAGPAANAIVRVSSIRPLATGSALGLTSAGTSAGAATLNATVPHAPIKPRIASRNRFNPPSVTNAVMTSSETTRSNSARDIRLARGMRSAHTPAGIENSRNGSVCAVCKTPVAASPAPQQDRPAQPIAPPSWTRQGVGTPAEAEIFDAGSPYTSSRSIRSRYGARPPGRHSGGCGRIRMIMRGPAGGIFQRPVPGNRVAVVPPSAYLNLAARSGVRARMPALNCLTGDGYSVEP